MSRFSQNESLVLVNLPKAGLGNKLFVWARGLVFAYLNELSLLISPWEQLTARSFLRGSNRFYLGHLRSTPLSQFLFYKATLRFYEYQREPDLEKIIPYSDSIPTAYIFDQIPHWFDPFQGIKQHRDYVRNELLSIIRTRYSNEINTLKAPLISIHVRRGDFRELATGEDFARVGGVRTPLQYFSKLIQQIQTICGQSIPITIFSDGTEQELEELLVLPSVQLSISRVAIVDLILMSKSKLIISSAGSTFSQWAGFLSSAAVIHHPDHFHTSSRSTEINELYFEGIIPSEINKYPPQLLNMLTSLVET